MENEYGIIKATPSLPVIDLFRVPHEGKTLVVAHPAFGSNTYRNNLGAMSKEYYHSKELPKISFRPATTSESISIVSYDFETSKKEIFDPRWLQTSYVVRTQYGVFVNTQETDESVLKSMLNKCEKVNGIYLGKNDFGCAPYETFEQGIKDCDTFARGGLARVLEHTGEKIPENLRIIASLKFYKRGVNVCGFDEVKKPILKVAGLISDRGFDGDGLSVDGSWGDDNGGYAFGIVKENN